MENDKKCPFLDKYNGDGIEDTYGHDYYSCRILINEDLKKYDCYCSVDRICDVLDYEECEIYKKEKMKKAQIEEQKDNNKQYKRCFLFWRNRGGKKRMSEADKMFEELGYKKLTGETTEVYTLSRANKNIAFSKLIERIRIYGKYDFIDMQELKAINKKCEELGWI